VASTADARTPWRRWGPARALRAAAERLDSQRLLVWLLPIGLLSLATLPAIDSDLFWHLANGRWILQHGLPTHDVYSFSATDHLWVVHEWLADVLAYGLYGLGGYPALSLAAALVVAAGFGFVFALLRQGGASPTSAAALTLVSALAASTTWGARPQILNFLLLAVLAWYLFRLRAGGAHLVVLPALFLLWANLHSAYLAGLGFAVLFAIGESIQRWRETRLSPLPTGRLVGLWWSLLIAGALSLVNPGTFRTLLFPLGTLSSRLIEQNIQEWASPDFHSLAGLMLALLIIVLFAGLLTGKVRADLTEALLAPAFLVLALISSRHVPLFVVAGAPLLGRCAGALERTLGRARPSSRPAVGPPSLARAGAHALVLVAAGTLMIGARLLPNAMPDRQQAELAATQPVAAATFLQGEPPRDIFNQYGFGGYLVWTLQPHGDRVFIDGRVEVYGDRIFSDYLAVNSLAPNWREILDRYQVGTVLMPPGHPLVGLLEASGWRVAYRDRVAAVLVRW
jgi:hypothetical protein